MFSAIASGLGSFGGAVLQYYGQKEANQMTRDSAREANWANAEEAEKNRKYQTEMSNTAHQRAVADLKKAGLNPLLAANQSASTPAGSAGTNSGYKAESNVQAAVATAMEMKQLALAIEKQKEDIRYQRKQGELTDRQKSYTDAQTAKAKQETKALGLDAVKGEAAQTLWEKGKQLFKSNAPAKEHKQEPMLYHKGMH